MSHFVKAKIPITVVNIQFLGKLAKRNLCANVKTPAKQLSPEIIAKREKYLLFERDFENKVDYAKLSDKEKEIHFLHKEAIEQFKWTYIDPATGNKASTRFRKYLLEKCCGSGCRHCIYDHEAVPATQKLLKRFNTAFWTPVDNPPNTENIVIPEIHIKPKQTSSDS